MEVVKVKIMKKILVILLLLQSTIVFGKWSLVSEADDYRGLYIDLSTLKKINAYYEIWILMDLEKPMEGSSFTKNIPIKSFKERIRISCLEDKVKNLTIVDYSERMGNGEILNTLDEGEWRYPNPDSVIYQVMKIVCKQQ